ncbi:hypothetical protein [Planobispora longispora]
MTANDDAVPAALHQFSPFASRRILLIALFFGAAALAFAALAAGARAAWRGSPATPPGARRRPALVTVPAGLLSLAYLAGLALVYLHEPVRDYQDHPIVLDDSLVQMPFEMSASVPGWYLPALAATLLAAALTQVASVALLIRGPITGGG